MRARRLLLAALALVPAACRPAAGEMARDGRLQPYEPSPFFADGGSARHLPQGTVPRPAPHDGAVPRLGEANAPAAPASRAGLRALLLRGQERFGIWCSPCHGFAGAGDGAVVQRGYPRPPPFTEARLREAPDAHLYRVLTDGLGKMPPYGPHVPPADRRAILAWIRVLQRSQHATLADAPRAEQQRLERMPDDGDRPR